MIIGIVSDIHGHLSDEAHRALEGSDMILCAGDTESPFAIMELEGIAPTIAVRGNCDRRDFGNPLPSLASPLIGGVRFYLVHRPEDIGAIGDDVRVVVHGHTHRPREEYRGDVLYLNPGSPTDPRGGSTKSVVRLVANDGRIDSVEFIDVT